MGAMVGYFAGMFLALGGCAYIWLGLLSALRIRKRWPRASALSAAAIAGALGLATASSGTDPSITVIATVGVVVLVLWRESSAKPDKQPAAQEGAR